MSKITLLFVGDIHFGANKPDSRTDDFYNTSLEKINEIISIAKQNNVDAVLQAGDLFDTPKPPYNVIGDLVNALNPIKKFIMIPGNHEMPGNTESSLERSALALLKGIKCVEFAQKENPIYIEKNGYKVAITGSRYTPNIDTKKKDSYIVETKMADTHIHLVHGMLTDEYMGEMIYHTTIDEISNTEADITLAGHDHLGFGIIKKNQKIFINNGAVLRLTCSTKEIKRKVVVTLIEIYNGEINIRTISLKSALEGERVLDRSKLDDKKARELYRARLSTLLDEQVKPLDSIDVFDLIDNIGESESIENEIQEECKVELETIIEELDGEKLGSNQQIQPSHITKITLENFESHRYSEINCSEGLNVIVGQSNSGKSSIFKALKWVYMNEPSRGTEFITVGEKYCKVTVQLSNGYKIIREKHRDTVKEKGKKKEEKINRYIIINPDGSNFWEEGEEANKFNHEKVPKEVKDILKINSMKYDSDNEINFNFLEQIKPCFFLDEKAPSKAKIMGMFFGTHYIDESIRRLTAKEKEYSKEIKIKNKEIQTIDDNLNKYEYLDETQVDIDKIKELLKERQLIINEQNELYNTRTEYNEIITNINKNKKILKDFNELDINNIKHKKNTQSINLITLLVEYNNEVDTLKLNDNKYKQLLVFEETINQLIKKVNINSVDETQNIIEIHQEFAKINNMILENEKAISLTNSVKNNETNYKRILDKIILLPELIQLQNEYFSTINKVEENTIIINNKKILTLIKDKFYEYQKINDEYEFVVSNINEYKNILKEIRNTRKALDLTSNIKINYEKDLDIFDKINKIDKIVEYEKEYEEILNQIITNKNKINKSTQIIDKTLKEYEVVLMKIGKCPICLSDINKETIDRIINEYSIKKYKGD